MTVTLMVPVVPLVVALLMKTCKKPITVTGSRAEMQLEAYFGHRWAK